MIEPVTVSTALGMVKVLNKPLTDLYEYLKKEAKFNIEKNKFDDISKKLNSKINTLKKVKTIYKGDEAIDLHNFYYPPKLIIDNVVVGSEDLRSILSENIVIQGIAGQGKSILLRYLSISECEKNEKLPIFMELRKINKEGDIIKFIKQNLEDIISDISDDLLKWVLKSGKIILFLDGFDELKEDDVANTIKDLEKIAEIYPETQIVISSRPDGGIQASNFFKIINIKPYMTEDQIGLIRILVEEQDSYENIVTALEKSTLDIGELLSTPLMITMFVMIYRAKLIIPDTVSKFYQDLFSVLIYKHDRTKPGYLREFQSGLDELTLQEWFEYFCFISKNKNKLAFENRIEILEYIKSTLINKFEKEAPTKILNDINKNLCLIIRDGGNYNFVHKTIQEYYAASYIKNRNEKNSKIIYEKIHKITGKFRIELTFLEQIDSYRFNKYLLIPALSEFFEFYKKNQSFKESIKVIDTRVSDERSKELAEGYFGIMMSKSMYYKEFTEYYLNKVMYIYNDHHFIPPIMGLGGFESFFHNFNFIQNLVEGDIIHSKCTKFLLTENGANIERVYSELKNIYNEALKNISFEEDISIFDMMEENPL